MFTRIAIGSIILSFFIRITIIIIIQHAQFLQIYLTAALKL